MTYTREYAETPRFRYRPTKGGDWKVRGVIVKKLTFTVRCLFCYAHYEASLGPRIACPVCGRVEAER